MWRRKISAKNCAGETSPNGRWKSLYGLAAIAADPYDAPKRACGGCVMILYTITTRARPAWIAAAALATAAHVPPPPPPNTMLEKFTFGTPSDGASRLGSLESTE